MIAYFCAFTQCACSHLVIAISLKIHSNFEAMIYLSFIIQHFAFILQVIASFHPTVARATQQIIFIAPVMSSVNLLMLGTRYFD